MDENMSETHFFISTENPPFVNLRIAFCHHLTKEKIRSEIIIWPTLLKQN